MDTERTYSRNTATVTFIVCFSLLPVLYKLLLGNSGDPYSWTKLLISTGIQLASCALLALPLLTLKNLWLTIPGFALLVLNFRVFGTYFSTILLLGESYSSYIRYKLFNISLILLTILLIYVLIRPSKNKGVIARYLFFIPSAFQLISLIILVYTIFFERVSMLYNKTRFDVFSEESIIAILVQILLLFAEFSISKWLVSPYNGEKYQKKDKPSHSSSRHSDNSSPRKARTISLMKHILLLMFTFGIWQFIWIYRTTDFLNSVKSAKYRNPTAELLLCIFVPFYSICWMYQSALRTDTLCENLKIYSEIASPCLLCAFLIPFVAPILIHEKINTCVNR